jgi:hypothetical protein
MILFHCYRYPYFGNALPANYAVRLEAINAQS